VPLLVARLVAACIAAVALAAHADHLLERPALGASVASDSRGITWVVYRQGVRVMLRESPDGGATWSEARMVNRQPEDVEAARDSFPRVAIGRAGEVFVTWTRALSKPDAGVIRFARSSDGGRTFDDPVTVHVDRQPITHRFNAMAVTPQGRLFVAWIDSRDGRTGLYFTVSDDGGKTFRRERAAAAGACECCRIALVAHPDGRVSALWRHVFEPDIRDHALMTFGADGEVGTMRRATFDGWHLEGCPHHGPSLALDGDGGFHAVWFSGTPGKEGVYYGRLVDGRVEGQRRVGAESAGHADLAVIGKRIAIAWKEQDGEKWILKAMRSDDGGRSWRTFDVATAGTLNDHPKVFTWREGFRVLWNTREEPLKVVALP
jgi:hypothetical protein